MPAVTSVPRRAGRTLLPWRDARRHRQDDVAPLPCTDTLPHYLPCDYCCIPPSGRFAGMRTGGFYSAGRSFATTCWNGAHAALRATPPAAFFYGRCLLAGCGRAGFLHAAAGSAALLLPLRATMVWTRGTAATSVHGAGIRCCWVPTLFSSLFHISVLVFFVAVRWLWFVTLTWLNLGLRLTCYIGYVRLVSAPDTGRAAFMFVLPAITVHIRAACAAIRAVCHFRADGAVVVGLPVWCSITYTFAPYPFSRHSLYRLCLLYSSILYLSLCGICTHVCGWQKNYFPAAPCLLTGTFDILSSVLLFQNGSGYYLRTPNHHNTHCTHTAALVLAFPSVHGRVRP